MNPKILKKALIIIIIILFGFFIWPTPYTYSHIGKRPVKINRITQEVTFLKIVR